MVFQGDGLPLDVRHPRRRDRRSPEDVQLLVHHLQAAGGHAWLRGVGRRKRQPITAAGPVRRGGFAWVVSRDTSREHGPEARSGPHRRTDCGSVTSCLQGYIEKPWDRPRRRASISRSVSAIRAARSASSSQGARTHPRMKGPASPGGPSSGRGRRVRPPGADHPQRHHVGDQVADGGFDGLDDGLDEGRVARFGVTPAGRIAHQRPADAVAGKHPVLTGEWEGRIGLGVLAPRIRAAAPPRRATAGADRWRWRQESPIISSKRTRVLVPPTGRRRR